MFLLFNTFVVGVLPVKKHFCRVGVLIALAAQAVSAQEVVQGPYGVDGTWNIYELGDELLTWADALEAAQSKTREGVQGDLASIHSFEENQALSDLALNGIFWIGATDREGAAPQVMQNGFLSPQESIQLEEEEFDDPAINVEAAVLAGWAWTSGEPFCFHNWPVGGEPNNWDGTGPGEADVGFEDATFVRADMMWNDAPSGYAENEPVVPTLQPGTSTEELEDLPNLREYDFVIEYRTNSPTPFPGIDQVGDDPIYEDGCAPTHVNTGDPNDFDGDGELGLGDVDLLLAEVAAATNNPDFDVTGDGSVNLVDILSYVGSAETLNTYMGDANLDGEFNSSDFVAVFTAGLFETGNPATWATGDWNGDGIFGSGDFVTAFTDGGYELGPKPAPANVPEPNSILLVLLGAIGIIQYRRR